MVVAAVAAVAAVAVAWRVEAAAVAEGAAAEAAQAGGGPRQAAGAEGAVAAACCGASGPAPAPGVRAPREPCGGRRACARRASVVARRAVRCGVVRAEVVVVRDGGGGDTMRSPVGDSRAWGPAFSEDASASDDGETVAVPVADGWNCACVSFGPGARTISAPAMRTTAAPTATRLTLSV